MSARNIVAICNAISAIASCAAAWCWYKSTKEKVNWEEGGNKDGIEFLVDGTAFVATAMAQAKWNRFAACAAAIAAFFQTIGILLNI